MKELDYVELYARELRQNHSLFDQQKRLIESQLKSSYSLFAGMFKDNFKDQARIYLKKIGLI